jgi:(p)ppGpp synthase/HD superfamily hydrolase
VNKKAEIAISMWLTYLLICLVAILIIVDYYPNVDARIVGLLIGVVCDGNTPYITHPRAVAEAIQPNQTVSEKDLDLFRATALLHDVLEDTETKPSDLRQAGVDGRVITAVMLLTKSSRVSYLHYILNVKENRIAREVKIRDIEHNMSSLGMRDKNKRDKYMMALWILMN